MYEERAVSAEFRELAMQADREFRDFQREPAAAGERDGDAILARSCVYGYLYERHFLASPELLLNELRWLQRTGRPRAPGQALSAERFEHARDLLLEQLIARFDAQARD